MWTNSFQEDIKTNSPRQSKITRILLRSDKDGAHIPALSKPGVQSEDTVSRPFTELQVKDHQHKDLSRPVLLPNVDTKTSPRLPVPVFKKRMIYLRQVLHRTKPNDINYAFPAKTVYHLPVDGSKCYDIEGVFKEDSSTNIEFLRERLKSRNRRFESPVPMNKPPPPTPVHRTLTKDEIQQDLFSVPSGPFQMSRTSESVPLPVRPDILTFSKQSQERAQPGQEYLNASVVRCQQPLLVPTKRTPFIEKFWLKASPSICSSNDSTLLSNRKMRRLRLRFLAEHSEKEVLPSQIANEGKLQAKMSK